MKLPALWIAASFAAGIAIATRWPGPLKLWVTAAIAAMLLGAVLLWRSKTHSAWVLALVAWAALGGLAVTMERAAVPANNVTRLIRAGRLDTTEPLRWQGRLREDPMALPWGRRYEVDLEQVDVGGADMGEEVVSPYLWSRGLKSLDVVALTHADHDHLDGLYSVLENFQVRELWVGSDDPRPAFQRLLAEARSRGVAVVHKSQGAQFDWQGVEGEVLWPPADEPVGKIANNSSLVLRLSDGRTHFLLTGDIEKQTEEQLVAEQMPLAADFLKVPHHGSKTSSTQAFLTAVAPRVAVVSVGESNAFGHPAPEIVERYDDDAIRLLRTDRDGAITALTDGQNLSVRAYVEQP